MRSFVNICQWQWLDMNPGPCYNETSVLPLCYNPWQGEDGERNIIHNRTARFKNLNTYLNTNIYSYLETTGGQSCNLYLNVVHYFNTSVN